jgi:putative ABC transport system permease protein
MNVDVLDHPVTGSGGHSTTGGVPARRAMIRWAWRLFKREWRQQLLILLLVVAAVAAIVVGATVATNTPPSHNAGYGTASDLATFASSGKQSADPHSVGTQIAALRHRFGTVQVIENQTLHVPGSTQTYQLRSQDPNGERSPGSAQHANMPDPTAAEATEVSFDVPSTRSSGTPGGVRSRLLSAR